MNTCRSLLLACAVLALSALTSLADGGTPLSTTQPVSGDTGRPSDYYTANLAGRIGTAAGPVVWTNLSTGVKGAPPGVFALAQSVRGDVFALGCFTNAGGVAANGIARWNGGAWMNLGAGLNITNSNFGALVPCTNGDLYAGSGFTLAGGAAAANIAKWNGSSWTNLGSGVNMPVLALAVAPSGDLYAGGYFTAAGGAAAKYVAKWNGSAWSSLGSGMNLTVNALAVAPNGDLYAGGAFTNAGGAAANRVAKWNGSAWTGLGSGMNGTVYSLAAAPNGDLYAGGSFSTAGGTAAVCIAKWNGSAWAGLSSGVNSSVYALAVASNRDLYAGGIFTNAGGVAASRIAKWGPVPAGDSGVSPTHGSALGCYPVTITGSNLGSGSDITSVTLCGVAAAIVSQSATQVVVTASAGAAGVGDVAVYSAGYGLTVATNAFTYTEAIPPAIAVQPVSAVVTVGQTVGLSVTPGGDKPFGFQWLKDGALLPGQTNATLSLSPFKFTDSGCYQVTITNAAGMALSIPASLSVPNAPLRTWGNNAYGQLGFSNPATTNLPVTITNNAVATAVGEGHSLFVMSDGTLRAIGSNVYGQLGDGTTNNASLPVYITNGVAAVAAGAQHSLFVKSDGTLWAMGRNAYGQLGDGSNSNTNLPVYVTNGVVAVAVGAHQSLFVRSDGTLWAMGQNGDGQLGIGTNANTNRPVWVASGAVSVSAGSYHSLLIKSDGTLWAMGLNSFGQLGIGATTSTNLPVYVTNGVTAAAGGNGHSLFVTTNGTLRAMGFNGSGQLGNGTQTDAHSPIVVTNDGAAVAAGQSHSLFVKADGTLWGMGRNLEGQLGNATNSDSSLPVRVGKGGLLAACLAKSSTGQHSVAIASGVPVVSGLTNQTAFVGQQLNLFAAVIDGDGPFAYQWQSNGTNLVSATNATFTIASVAAADAGSYAVVVRGPYGNTASACATLTVMPSGGISLEKDALAYISTYAGDNPAVQTARLTNVGGSGFAYTNAVSYGAGAAGWLTAQPAAGSITVGGGATLTFGVSSANMNAGAYTATNLVIAADATNSPQAVVVTLTVAKASQAISFPAVADQLTTGRVCLAAAADSGLPVAFAVAAGSASIAGGTNLTFTGAGTVSVAAFQAGGANYNAAASVTNTFEVSLASQAELTFAPVSPQAYATTNALSVTGGSGTGAVSYAVQSGPGRIVGASGLTATSGSGAITVVATKAADALYAVRSVSATVACAKAGQAITFPALADQFWTNRLVLAASASSGLTPEFSVVSGPALLGGGSTLSFTGYGAVRVAAAQAGDGNYGAAATVTNSFSVLGPQLAVFGTNGIAVASSNAVSSADGTDFGELALGGGAQTNEFTVTNIGGADAVISGVTITGPGSNAFEIVTQTDFPAIARVHEQVSFRLAFRPLRRGVQAAVFSFHYNGTNTPYRVNVAGVGLGGAIALATNALAYAAAYSGASPAAQTVRLANGGVGVFGYTNEIVYGPGAKDWLTAQPAAGIIPAGGAQTLTFAVNSARLGMGIYTATNYVIAADATNSPQAVVVTLTIWLPPPVWLAPAPVGAGQFTLNWEAPEVGDGYWLEVAPTADFRGLTVGTNIVGQAVRSFDVVHVGAGSTNYCRIKTLRGATAGTFGDVLKVVASAGAPYPVDRIPLWQTVTVGGSNTWDLGTLFAGSGLTFAVTSAVPAVVGVRLQSSAATFSYLTVGTAAVTVSARNAAGLSSAVTVMFDVTPRDGVGLAAGTPQFVPKLNVYAQTVWVTNNTGSTVSAVKLSVKGILPAKTTLREATSQTGTDAVLLWNGALPPGEAVQFNLTFLNPALTQVTVGSIVSEFSVVSLMPAVTFDPAPVKIANLGATRDLSGVGIAGFLLEFPTKKGAIYHIFYRDSLTGVDWVRVLKPVTALGTWQMWYDTGAPVTAPLGGARFYKVQKQQ